MTKVVALAGGVGGAKLVYGLSKILDPSQFSAIINTGDDFSHLGLMISPDIDSVVYSLAGLTNDKTGWGRKDETWNCLSVLKELNSETWFQIGDKDLGLHLERTKLLNQGLTLTEVTKALCKKMGVLHSIFPMSDDPVRTMIETEELGEIPFQEYFVKHHFQPRYRGIRYAGIEAARLSKKALRELQEADLVIICPSNPWLSIFPILEIPHVKNLLKKKTTIAVSPIIGNSAVKGPASKIFNELGIKPSGYEVAKMYRPFLTGFVLDHENELEQEGIRSFGIIPLVTDTLMKNDNDKQRLASEVLGFAINLKKDLHL